MSIVFVHGVPETGQIWDGVRERIGRDSVAVDLPGFGTPRPEGFGATKDDYVHWLMEWLVDIDGPIDLVGHDWGAGFVARIATAHGQRIRSWACDVVNIFHPDYVWHDFAQIWQTPGEGEAFWDGQLALDADTGASVFEGFGVPHDAALKLFSHVDHTMSRCILDLYRSAVPNAHHDWGQQVGPTDAPGLVIQAPEDPFGNHDMAKELIDTLGARTTTLDGLGHWWMLQDPERGAAALTAFWDELGL